MKRFSQALWLAALVSLWVPSVKATLYQIDTNDHTATPSGYLDISAYAASTGGLWSLLDGHTYVNQFGFNTPVRGLPDGVSLVSLSSSTASTIYARGSDGILYLIDTNDHTASPTGYQDINAYASSTGGLWSLLDGHTYVNQFGFNTPVRGLPDGVSLVSLSSSTASTIYARGDDGILYLIDTNDHNASPTGYLDISAYAASTGGVWGLVDGDTYVNQFGFNTPIRGLPDGVSIDSFSSSTSTTIYAYAVPEPSTIAFLIIGSLSLLLRRKPAQRCSPLPRSSAH